MEEDEKGRMRFALWICHFYNGRYHYDATSSPSCKPTHTFSLATFTWVCLGGLQYTKSGNPAQFTTFGLKCGVDCCAFKITSHPDNKNEV